VSTAEVNICQIHSREISTRFNISLINWVIIVKISHAMISFSVGKVVLLSPSLHISYSHRVVYPRPVNVAVSEREMIQENWMLNEI
jgi:hypothetical protein